MQRREPVLVGHGCARTGANQQIGNGQVVDMGGPVKRGRAIALRRVYVDALLDERAHGRRILASHGLDEARIGARGARAPPPTTSTISDALSS